MRIYFLAGILFFFSSFAAHKIVTKPITVFLHENLARAEMHYKENGQVFCAELVHKSPQTQGNSLSFQCGANDSETIIRLLQAIGEAERAAQEQKIKADSQWMKTPEAPIYCFHKTPPVN